MTVLDLLDQIQTHLGVPWQSQRAGGYSDGVLAGDPYATVSGIVTCFTPTVDVLRRAISSGHNTIICRESPFYSRGEQQSVAYRSRTMPAKESLNSDSVCQAKMESIKTNSQIIIRFVDNWDARKRDGQLEGLVKAIKWEQYHLVVKGDKDFYRPGNNFFSIPPTTIGALTKQLMHSLNAKTIRVTGSEDARVQKVAILHGLVLVPDLQAAFAQPGVDLVIAGEPVEWEGAEYIQDIVAAKMAKGAIFLGSEVSEEPGSGEVAAWLKTFVQRFDMIVKISSYGDPILQFSYRPEERAILIDGEELGYSSTEAPQVHGYFDGSVIELVVNRKHSYTKRFYHDQARAPDISLILSGAKTGNLKLAVWKINSISDKRLTKPNRVVNIH